uniref:UPAR/Ly6 domain-containing protein n=1 Tax=Astatotilapia calliptera TaxID=8154 RepID=A0A3P8PM98_ASTCA
MILAPGKSIYDQHPFIYLFSFFSVFVNCFCLPSVCGLMCYTCLGANPGSCTRICPLGYDYCSTTLADSLGIRCCSEDLCNGAKQTGVFVPLLLAPLAIITLFI